MRHVLFAAAQSLTIAGVLILAGWFGPPAEPAEPRTSQPRLSTPAEERRYERDQLLDVLRAQQQSGQK